MRSASPWRGAPRREGSGGGDCRVGHSRRSRPQRVTGQPPPDGRWRPPAASARWSSGSARGGAAATMRGREGRSVSPAAWAAFGSLGVADMLPHLADGVSPTARVSAGGSGPACSRKKRSATQRERRPSNAHRTRAHRAAGRGGTNGSEDDDAMTVSEAFIGKPRRRQEPLGIRAGRRRPRRSSGRRRSVLERGHRRLTIARRAGEQRA